MREKLNEIPELKELQEIYQRNMVEIRISGVIQRCFCAKRHRVTAPVSGQLKLCIDRAREVLAHQKPVLLLIYSTIAQSQKILDSEASLDEQIGVIILLREFFYDIERNMIIKQIQKKIEEYRVQFGTRKEVIEYIKTHGGIFITKQEELEYQRPLHAFMILGRNVKESTWLLHELLVARELYRWGMFLTCVEFANDSNVVVKLRMRSASMYWRTFETVCMLTGLELDATTYRTEITRIRIQEEKYRKLIKQKLNVIEHSAHSCFCSAKT
jgi:hypothetical protein